VSGGFYAQSGLNVTGNILVASGLSTSIVQGSNVAVFSNASGFSNVFIINSLGQVGIGSTAVQPAPAGAGTNTPILFVYGTSTSSHGALIQNTGGSAGTANVCINTDGTNPNIELRSSINTGSPYIDFAASNPSVDYDARMTLVNNGNTFSLSSNIIQLTPTTGVGIGTASPSGVLDVRGTSMYVGNQVNSPAASGATSNANIILYGAGNNPITGSLPSIYHRGYVGLALCADYNISFEVNAAVSRADAMRITSAGNVGINTASPNQKLHVYGNMQLDRAAAAYTTTLATTTYAAGTWYTLVPTGALTQASATYLVSMVWQSNPGANPWTLSMSFLWYNQYCNDNNTSQLSGAAVPMSYHATNASGDYQISIRAQSASSSYPAIQWKCNTALSNAGYWSAWCNIISY